MKGKAKVKSQKARNRNNSEIAGIDGSEDRPNVFMKFQDLRGKHTPGDADMVRLTSDRGKPGKCPRLVIYLRLEFFCCVWLLYDL